MNHVPGRQVIAQQALSPPPPTSPSTSPAAGVHAGFVGPLIHANEVRHRRALAGRGLLGTPRVAKLTNTLQESLPPLAGLQAHQQPHDLTTDLHRRLGNAQGPSPSWHPPPRWPSPSPPCSDSEELRNSLLQATRQVSSLAGWETGSLSGIFLHTGGRFL